MEITNKAVDDGKAFDWGKHLLIMPSIEIFIQKYFIKNCAKEIFV